MAAEIRILDVFKMLEVCAPDHRRKETTHSFIVKLPFGAKVVTAALPSGPHGKLERRKISSPAVRSFASKLGILECASRYLPL